MLKRLFLVLLGIAVLPLLAVGAVAAYIALVGPVTLDLSPYRNPIALQLSRFVGLEFQVRDALVLTLSDAAVDLRVDGLMVENPRSGDAEPLAEVRSARAAVALRPLLTGVVKPLLLFLDQGRVRLLVGTDGRGNWAIGESAPEAETDAPLALDWLDLRGGGRIDVADSELSYVDESTGQRVHARVDQARARPAAGGTSIDLDLEAALGNEPIRLTGRVGTLDTLVLGRDPYPLKIEADVAGLRLAVDGTIALPTAAVEVAAAAQVQADSLHGLQPLLGKAAARAYAPLDLRLEVRGDAQRFEVDRLQARIGKGRIAGNLRLGDKAARPKLEGDLSLEGLDLRPLLGEGGGAPAPGAKASAPAKPPARGEPARLLPADPLPFDWLSALDARLRLRAKQIRFPYQTLRSLDAKLVLEDRLLTLTLDGATNGVRSLRLRQTIDGRVDPPRFAAELDAKDIDIGHLVADTKAQGAVRGAAQLASDKLRSRGRSVRDIVLALEGDLLFLMADGKADVGLLNAVVGGLSGLLGQLVAADSALADLRCGLVDLKFGGGVATTKAVVDTNYSLVVVSGDLDLRNRTLDLLAEPKGKGVTLSVATPIRIVGPIEAPEIRIREMAALTTLTRLTAKIAMPSLILVDAFGDEMRDNPCVTLSAPDASGVAGGAIRDATGAVLGGAGGLFEGAGAALGLGERSSQEAAETPKDASATPGAAVSRGAGAVRSGAEGLIKGTGKIFGFGSADGGD